MSFTPNTLRGEFPLLALAQQPLHYLDNAATSQIHMLTLKAMNNHDMFQRANVMRGNHRLAEAATAAYENARDHVARFLNATSAEEVVFTSGATAALNLVAHGFGATLGPGDEVVISLAEHHSNFVPWQLLAQRKDIALRILPLAPDGRIDCEALACTVTERCRLIAVTHASNVTGAVSDVATLVAVARTVGACVLLDGAQQVQHGPVDVRALGVDFYAFSGHKCFGPSGIGVLWGRSDVLREMEPLMSGGGMVAKVDAGGTVLTTFLDPPRRFEAGTPPITAAVGLGATLAWLGNLPWPEIHAYETKLLQRLLDGLATKSGLRLLGPANCDARLPIVAFEIDGCHPHDICQVLDQYGVAVRGGHLCAAPLMTHFGVDAACRASIAFYNTVADIDALLDALDRAIDTLS